MLKIIKAKRIHLEKIADLWEEFMDHHSRIEPILTRLPNGRKRFLKNIGESFGDPDWQLFVAIYENEIVGFANVKIMKYPPVLKKYRYGYIQDMAVSGKYRRLGIGEAMFKEIIKWYKQKKIKRVELLALCGNQVAESFWRKVGFKDYMIRMKTDI
ncbi:MAG: GNAT family N-acetyltransferase [Candidatus Zixiibacteriota bacterium]